MGAGASVLCGGQRRLLVPVALIVSTSEPFHSHVGVRALENMERVFVSPYQFQFNHTKQQKPRTLRNLTKTYGQQQLTDQKRKPIKTQQRFREIQHTTTESKYSSQTEIFNNLGCDSHPFSISTQVVTTNMVLLNETCKVYIDFCLAMVSKEIEQNREKNYGIDSKEIGMATGFLFVVCGFVVCMAFMMAKVKASDADSKVDQKTVDTIRVYVFPTGKSYHSSKCVCSRREDNERLGEPTEMSISQAQRKLKTSCGCLACDKFFRALTLFEESENIFRASRARTLSRPSAA